MKAFVEGDVEQALELIDHQQCDIKWLRELPSNSLIVAPSPIIDQGQRWIREFILAVQKQLPLSNRALAQALESIDRLEESLEQLQSRGSSALVLLSFQQPNTHSASHSDAS